jgi:PucR C-terminal helix-turn-helix domain/GGDEF-like domain
MHDFEGSINGADQWDSETDQSPLSASELVQLTKPNPGLPARPGVDATWDVLFDTLLGEHEDLARRVREAILVRLPAYRSILRTALDVEVGLEVRQVLQSARSGQAALNEREIGELAAIGESRARQGVPIDDMLHAWRIGVEVVIDCAREVGRRLGVADAQLLEFIQSALASSDTAMVATADAHRRAELAQALAADEGRATFVRATLLGTIPSAELRIQAEVYGLDPAGEYVAIRARLSQDVAQAQLEQTLGFQDPAQDRRGLCALVDGDLAGLLSTPPPTQVDAVVGFGPPRPLEHLTESYRLAARALLTAEACGLRGTYDIASLGLRPAVAMDADIGELLRKRYLQPLAGASSATELIATVRAYLACGMHVERTATRLFVHQNTVRYRIARFEELTGASLAETEVLTEVWWALELSAMRL